MKSKILASLVVLGLFAVGCGDDTSGSGGGTGGSGGGATTSTGGSGQGPAVTTGNGAGGSGGGTTGDGNDSFAEAQALNLDEGFAAALDPAESDLDFYSFEGTAGQAIQIVTDAKSGALGLGPGDGFIDGYADLVIELYDSNETLIATNDDPIPRNTQDSSLLTVLPATGKYYIRVSEFCLTWPQGPLGANCYSTLDVPDYGIAVLGLDPATNSVIQATEPNDDGMSATPWEFEVNPNASSPGVYYASIAYGDFGASGDTDYFAFMPPADVSLDVGGLFTGRLSADLEFYPSGTMGSGATDDMGVVNVIDATSGDTIASLDIGAVMDPTFGAGVSVPVSSQNYYLQFTPAAGAAFGAGYFYFAFGTVGPNNPVEGDAQFELGGAGNETIADADDMYEQSNMDMDSSTSWFIEGDIDSATDVDYLRIPLNGQPLLSVYCSGLNLGAGLTVKASVVDGTDALVDATATKTETLGQQDFLTDVPVPASGDVYLKIEQGAQSANVTGTFYRCGVRNYTTAVN